MKRRPGRPKKNLKLITYKEIVEKVGEFYQGKHTPKIGSIYNKMSRLIRLGEVTRYGNGAMALFDESQALEKLCS